MLTEAEWDVIGPYLEPNPDGLVEMLDDKDRELAKAILKSKGHLGPLGYIEVGIALGRVLRDLQKTPAKT
mgnify:CR=1 FL=1